MDGVLLLSPFFWSLMNATNRSRNSGVSSGRAVITSEFCWDPAIPQLSCGPVEHRPANEAAPATLGWLSWAQCASRQQRQFNIYNLIWPLNIFSLFLSCLALHGGTAHITWKVSGGTWRSFPGDDHTWRRGFPLLLWFSSSGREVVLGGLGCLEIALPWPVWDWL